MAASKSLTPVLIAILLTAGICGCKSKEQEDPRTLLLFHVPFGFNAILGLIALAGILMRNTLILIGQIKTNKDEGLDDFHAVVEATVQRSRPVVLTALAAVLAFIPLTFSVFWGSLAYTLIGGTAVGTVLTLVFLPALYTIWFGVKPTAREAAEEAQLVY